MQLKHVGRILAALGGLLLVSSVITWLIGAQSFVTLKIVMALVFFAAFFVTNWGHIGTSSAGRSSFFIGVTAVSGVAVVALLCLLNYMAVKRPMSWDFTSNKIHQLSSDTHATLRGLTQDVHALAFMRADDGEYALLKTLFEKYAALSPRFRFEFVDPVKDPLRVSQMNIRQEGPRVVLQSEGRESRFLEPTEEALTNALLQVTRTTRKKVGFTTGRGEVRLGDTTEFGLSRLAERLSGEGLDPVEIQVGEADIAKDIELVVVAGPRQPFEKDARNALYRFLLRGGRLLTLLEPGGSAGLEQLLGEFDLALEPALIVDDISRLQGASASSPLIHDYNRREEITRDFRIATVFPTVAPVKILTDDLKDGLSLTELAMSSSQSRLNALPAIAIPPPEPESEPRPQEASEHPELDEGHSGEGGEVSPNEAGDSDASAAAAAKPAQPLPAASTSLSPALDLTRKGPFPIAARVIGRLPPAVEGDPDRELRIVLVGDKDFATNGYSSVLGNEDFFLNSLNWLASQAERITIRPKLRTASRLYLTPERQAMLTFFIIDLLPISILAFGITLWMLRRSK
ncbi:MAG: GldG family protein [Myxococcales bacterium]|jgi:ABC-type uncharacterized transport system involved in gliding motility auxiliary subunit|nr:GldG family protein [Myxococcales bacterium]